MAINMYAYSQKKKNGLVHFSENNHGECIENLVVGSSHADYGLIPSCFESPTYNLGLTSADLFTIYHCLFNIKRHLSNLKRVIFVYSTFFKGYRLEKTTEGSRCCPSYFNIFSIPYDSKFSNLEIIDDNCFFDLQNYQGFNCPNDFMKSFASVRAGGHLKNHYRTPDQMDFLGRLIDLIINQMNLELYIVFPPYRADYLSFFSIDDVKDIVLSVVQCLKSRLSSEIISNVRIINLFGDQRFRDLDFGDSDHLNLIGARKFSKIVNSSIHNHEISSVRNYESDLISLLDQYNLFLCFNDIIKSLAYPYGFDSSSTPFFMYDITEETFFIDSSYLVQNYFNIEVKPVDTSYNCFKFKKLNIVSHSCWVLYISNLVLHTNVDFFTVGVYDMKLERLVASVNIRNVLSRNYKVFIIIGNVSRDYNFCIYNGSPGHTNNIALNIEEISVYRNVN